MNKTKELLKKQAPITQLKEDEDHIEYVATHIIKNDTGYPIEIRNDDSDAEQRQNSAENPSVTRKPSSDFEGKAILCDNENTVSYHVESDADQLFSQIHSSEKSKTKKVKCFIKHPEFALVPVSSIYLDSTQPSRRKLRLSTNPTKKKSTYELICQPQLVNNQKILALVSPIQFRNCTASDITIQLEEHEAEVTVKLLRGQTAAVPFDYIDKGLMTVVHPKYVSRQSARRSIQSYVTYTAALNEISVGSEFFIVKTTVDREVVYLEFHPPYVFSNCCPQPISYHMHIEGQKPVVSVSEHRGHNELLAFSRLDKLFIQLYLEGVGCSTDVMLYDPSAKKLIDEIYVESSEGSTLTLDLHTEVDPFGTCKIILYAKAMIINETSHHFIYYGCDEKTDNITRLLPGQSPLSDDTDFNPNLLLHGGSSKVAIARKESPRCVSPAFTVGAAGDQTIMIKDLKNHKAYEFGVNLSTVTASKFLCFSDLQLIFQTDREHCLFTNVIRISPRYILLNKTNQPLVIKGEGESTEMPVKPDVRTPFIWNDFTRHSSTR